MKEVVARGFIVPKRKISLHSDLPIRRAGDCPVFCQRLISGPFQILFVYAVFLKSNLEESLPDFHTQQNRLRQLQHDWHCSHQLKLSHVQLPYSCPSRRGDEHYFGSRKAEIRLFLKWQLLPNGASPSFQSLS